MSFNFLLSLIAGLVSAVITGSKHNWSSFDMIGSGVFSFLLTFAVCAFIDWVRK